MVPWTIKANDAQYMLQAVVVHEGVVHEGSASNGHYFAVVVDHDPLAEYKFTERNDDTVHRSKRLPDRVLYGGYLYFYVRKNFGEL
jgi:uncharacterized UBP type Zn finger protein